jgi:anti-anti-sigma factor
VVHALPPQPGDDPAVPNSSLSQPAGVEAIFLDEQALLSVRGELSVANAIKLGALFAATIASGYRSVVLNVADLDFMGDFGLRVLADAASRLVASGGELTVRSPAMGVPDDQLAPVSLGVIGHRHEGRA